MSPANVYEGGCHCGAVRFRVTLFDHRATECNCSICRKKGFIHLIVPRDRFELLSGEDMLTTYTFNTRVAQHTFCRRCGIHPFYTPRSHPRDVSVNARCLDEDLLMELEIEPFSGVNWEENIHRLAPVSDRAVVIRPATPEDDAEVRTIVHAALVEHGFTPDPEGLDADIEDIVTSYLAPGGAFDVMEDATGHLQGTVGLLPRAPGTCELRKMYLRPEARGRGLGRRLLEHALSRARSLGFSRVELETHAVFSRAIELYRRYGFRPVDAAPSGTPCDRLLALDLD